ncbi:MAG: toprim domain-containing protein [Hyphomicrobiaceae bacterium]|nr:toprim domain-containing protein [Hyphomicrobiaceae bacterium]
MARRDASQLAHRLAREAEAVCRQYLSNGRRAGRYWIVGDVHNTRGRSMYVQLSGPERGPGAAGKWTDAATGEHGDLLDVIRESLGLIDFRDVADEARRFLSLPRPEPDPQHKSSASPVPIGSPEAARRLIAASQPIRGTLVETYLRHRCLGDLCDVRALRYHPRCYHRREHGPTQVWPAMIASVTDLGGLITGAHRTWLDPSGIGKAPVETQRKAMGLLLGHAVRFGPSIDVMAAGEGIETVLSLRMALPGMSMMAALSAAHLSAILFPDTLRRLYIARDADAAGDMALMALTERAEAAGIEALALSPRMGDFNEDLRAFGLGALRAALRIQLAPQDVVRFMRQGTARIE